MKCVIATQAGAELVLLQSMLQQAGIPCVIRNEHLSELLGTTPFNAELWVESDDDLPPACELYAAWSATRSQPAASWECATCGHRLGMQFDSCWQCGNPRPRLGSLPCSCDDASQRADAMSSVLDHILHQSV
jgi:hypothetical protein